jgi:hypothetical protein
LDPNAAIRVTTRGHTKDGNLNNSVRRRLGDNALRCPMENFETAPFDRSGTSPRAIRRGRERAIAPSFGLRG